MKTFLTTIFAFLISANLNFVSAQHTTTDQLLASAPAGWELSENWLHDFRQNLGAYSSIGWINDAISDGAQMFTHSSEKGILLVQIEENEAQLPPSELAMETSFEAADVQLFSNGSPASLNYGSVSEWHGQIGGEEVILQKITLVPAGAFGEVISISSIVPVNSINRNLSSAFQAGQVLASQYSNENSSPIAQAK